MTKVSVQRTDTNLGTKPSQGMPLHVFESGPTSVRRSKSVIGMLRQQSASESDFRHCAGQSGIRKVNQTEKTYGMISNTDPKVVRRSPLVVP
jgi:hypothetical protein